MKAWLNSSQNVLQVTSPWERTQRSLEIKSGNIKMQDFPHIYTTFLFKNYNAGNEIHLVLLSQKVQNGANPPYKVDIYNTVLPVLWVAWWFRVSTLQEAKVVELTSASSGWIGDS